jgi:hypothetical protein
MDRMVPPLVHIVTSHADLYDRVQKAQEQDQEVTDIRQRVADAQAATTRTKTQKKLLKSYRENNGHLWTRPGQKGLWRLMVPRPLRKEVLHHYHDTALEGHPGIKATHTAITKEYQWRAALSDVRSHVQSCMVCACKRGGHRGKTVSPRAHKPQKPWEDIAVDLMGPYPRTARGKVNLLVVRDLFSRWTEAFPMGNA